MIRPSALALVMVLAPVLASGQTIGTFRWQLQPFCNIVSLTITQNGGVYELEGTDDQCGAAQAASASGTAFVNPDGSIGFGLAIVTSPNGTPVHVNASITLSTLSGTWHDSAGVSGALVFTPGAGAGGSPRPAATLGLSGVSLGFGLFQSGSPGQVSLSVDFNSIKSGLRVSEPASGSFGMGPNALTSAGSDAFANTAFGDAALFHTTTGDWNSAFGHEALPQNTTGFGNTAVGGLAMRSNVGGDDNTAVGTDALEDLVSSNGNTAIGSGALHNLILGNNNIAIGKTAGGSLVAGSNNVYLASGGVNLDNYTTRIGLPNPGSQAYIHGIRGVTTGFANAIPVVVDSAGQLGTISSSRRFKQEINDLGGIASALQNLRPVSFRYTKPFVDGGKPVQYGLIAEEVADVLPELVAYDADGEPETVMYHVLPTLLVAEIQRLERERAQLESRVEALARELASFKERIGKRR